LNVRSPDDLTTRARIRDAAVRRFGREGFAATRVRAVADDAGVSAGLVMHHFGSKEGLRTACDEYLLAHLAAVKTEAVGGAVDGRTILAALQGADDLLAYVARSFSEGSAHAAALFDSVVELSERVLAAGERAGSVRASADPRARAALLTAWSMSLLVLGEHLRRALAAPAFDLDLLLRLDESVLDVYTHGLFTDSRFAGAVQQAGDLLEASDG
jgi:TetR/AcrR family transcriptional regulator, regulator of cefoperazone and chloramphenicol sensitivity